MKPHSSFFFWCLFQRACLQLFHPALRPLSTRRAFWQELTKSVGEMTENSGAAVIYGEYSMLITADKSF